MNYLKTVLALTILTLNINAFAQKTGAIIGNIPVVASFDQDPTLAICDGDFIELDADAGTVVVTMRNPNRKIAPPRSGEQDTPNFDEDVA